MVGSKVHVIVMQPDPLLYLIGFGGALPLRVCAAEVKGVLGDGGHVQVDDSEIAAALGVQAVGHRLLAGSACFVDRKAAVDEAVAGLAGFVEAGFGRCRETMPDAGEALRRRFGQLTDGEVMTDTVWARAVAAGLT